MVVLTPKLMHTCGSEDSAGTKTCTKPVHHQGAMNGRFQRHSIGFDEPYGWLQTRAGLLAFINWIRVQLSRAHQTATGWCYGDIRVLTVVSN